MNIDKTKTVAITNKDVDRDDTVEQIANYRFLESTIYSKVKKEKDISKKIQSATKWYYLLQKKLLGDKNIISIYKTICVPVLTNAGENWILSECWEFKLSK